MVFVVIFLPACPKPLMDWIALITRTAKNAEAGNIGYFILILVACYGLVHATCVCPYSHIDHVTYVVRAGESQRILSWYGAACGMQRFLCTAAESREDGTVIGNDVGLR